MREHFFEVRGLRLHARLRGGAGFAGDGRSPQGRSIGGGAGFAGDGRSPKGPEPKTEALGTPLTLLLHGWLDHAGSFDKLAPLLPGRTAALDFRGHGDSAWLGPGGFYHFIDYLSDIDGALDALAPGEPARIVGHSMGAAAALLYIAARPGRVSHLTMIDAMPLTVAAAEVPARVTGHLDDLRSIPRQQRTVKSVEDAAERLLRNSASLSPQSARLLAEGGTGSFENGLAWKWDPLLRARSPLPVTEELVQLLTREIKTPILLLRGERGILPPEPETRARFPNLSFKMLTIPGTGHHVHLDAPEEVARLIALEP